MKGVLFPNKVYTGGVPFLKKLKMARLAVLTFLEYPPGINLQFNTVLMTSLKIPLKFMF